MSDDTGDENVDQGPAWGWGWLSGAAQAAKDAFDSSVKPALISMENSTSHFVQEVTKVIDLQIDEDPEHIDDTDAEKTPEKNPESSYPADQVPRPSDTAEEQEDDSILSDAIGSISYFGGVVKQIGAKLSDVDQMEASIRRGSEKLQSAFNDAYHFITDDEEVQKRPSTQPGASSSASAPQTPAKEERNRPNTASPSTPSTPASRGTLASPTFASLFESKMGAVDMSALENLSTQSSIHLQQHLRRLSDEQRVLAMNQQEELRAIFAPDLLANENEGLNFGVLELPALGSLAAAAPTDTTPSEEGEEVQARAKFQTALAALHQKIEFYASRTASLQSYALKAVSEAVIPEDGNIQALSEGTLNYRGKMQLEALRQVAEFTALSVHQILLSAEYVLALHKTYPSADIIPYAKLTHQLALTCKFHVTAISHQIFLSMKTLGNSFKEKASTAMAHPSTQSTGQATLKRISAGLNNVQLDLATAMASILDASRFTLAVFQHHGALNL